MAARRAFSIFLLVLCGAVGCFGGGGGGGEGEGSAGSQSAGSGLDEDSPGGGVGGGATFIPSGESGSGAGTSGGGAGSSGGGAGSSGGGAGLPGGGAGGVAGSGGSAGVGGGAGSSMTTAADAGGATATEATYYDERTGLAWAPAPAPDVLEYYDAEAYCDGLSYDGYDDWRLPSISELRTLSQCSLTEFVGTASEAIAPCRVHDNCTDIDLCYDPALCDGCAGAAIDPALGLDGVYREFWSATPTTYDPETFFVLGFDDGSVGPRGIFDNLDTLCVRGALFVPDFSLASCGTPCGFDSDCDAGQICAEAATGGLCVPADCSTCAGGTCNFNLSYPCGFDSCI